jgi:hypothetical protein
MRLKGRAVRTLVAGQTVQVEGRITAERLGIS